MVEKQKKRSIKISYLNFGVDVGPSFYFKFPKLK